MRDIAIASFTSLGTAAVTNVVLGFVPDFVEVEINRGGTNPNVYKWTNKALAGVIANTDDALLATGSTGVRTVATGAIDAYQGGDVPTSTDVTNKKFVDRAGVAIPAGNKTGPGIVIKAAIQVNSGTNVIRAWRADA